MGPSKTIKECDPQSSHQTWRSPARKRLAGTGAVRSHCWGLLGRCSPSRAARAQQGRGPHQSPSLGSRLLLWDGVPGAHAAGTGQGAPTTPARPGWGPGTRAGVPAPPPLLLPPLQPPQAEGPGASACSKSLGFFRIIRTQRLQTPSSRAGGFAAAPDRGVTGTGWGAAGTAPLSGAAGPVLARSGTAFPQHCGPRFPTHVPGGISAACRALPLVCCWIIPAREKPGMKTTRQSRGQGHTGLSTWRGPGTAHVAIGSNAPNPCPELMATVAPPWAAPRWDVTLRSPGLSPGTAPSRCRHSAIAVLCRAGVRAGAHPQACPGPCVGPHPAQWQPVPPWGQTRVTGVSSTGTSLCGRRGLCLISVCLTQVLRGEQPSLAHHPSLHRQDRNGRPGLSWDPRQSRFCSFRR